MTRLTKTIGVLFVCFLTMAPASVSAQTEGGTEVEVTHGGYATLGGALAAAGLFAATAGVAQLVYAPPRDVDCKAEPKRCRPTVLDHTIVGLSVGAALTGSYFAGVGSAHLTEELQWDPVLGWSLSGAYLGLVSTLLLQNVIPQFEPEWLRQATGAVVAAGGSVGAAYAFRAIALHEGHAWPEFGFGVGGLFAGLFTGSLIAPGSVWVPILGGLGSVAAASAATLAF